jgi:hypothetical protein
MTLLLTLIVMGIVLAKAADYMLKHIEIGEAKRAREKQRSHG